MHTNLVFSVLIGGFLFLVVAVLCEAAAELTK